MSEPALADRNEQWGVRKSVKVGVSHFTVLKGEREFGIRPFGATAIVGPAGALMQDTRLIAAL